MGEWQPIETAPKDGTEILVWVLAGRGCFNLAYFNGDEVLVDWDGAPIAPYVATHWMALPPPPATV